MTPLKKKYLLWCYDILSARRLELKQELEKVQASFAAETKSSAGDKYETSREMISQEKDKIYDRLAEIEKQEQTLSLIKKDSIHSKIALGSIVHTVDQQYFISISLGKLKSGSVEFLAVSPASPLAQSLLGKETGDTVVFLKKTYQIVSVD